MAITKKSGNPKTSDERLEDLVNRAQRGDEIAFAQLALHFEGVLSSLTAVYGLQEQDRFDLAQEGLLGLHRAVKSFDPSLSSFPTYATICMRSGVAEGMRKYRKDHEAPSSLLTEEIPAGPDHSPERVFLGKESLSQILKTVDKSFSPLERTVLELHLQGKKNREIALLLEKDAKSVENTLFRVRKKLSYLS